MDIRKISIYCASSSKIDPAYMQEAYKVGQLLAQMDITVVNGAGSMGLCRPAPTAVCKQAERP